MVFSVEDIFALDVDCPIGLKTVPVAGDDEKETALTS